MRHICAILAVFFWGAVAHANQIVTDPISFSMPFITGGMPVSSRVPLFNPTLGTLDRVAINIYLEIDNPVATLTNTDPVRSAFVYGDKFDFAVQAPNVYDIDNPSPIFPTLLFLESIAPGQTVTLTRNSVDDSFHSQTVTYAVPARPDYVGIGSAPVAILARYGLAIADSSLRLDVTAGTFLGHISATYDYTPAIDPVPEPGTAGMACLGIILGSGFFLRNRIRKG